MKTGCKLLNWSQLLQYSFSGITTVSLQLRIDIKKSLEIIMSIIAGEVHWDCSWRVLWWESGRLYSQCRPRHGSRLIIYQLINSQWENFSSPCSIEITILVIIIFIIVIMISIMKTQFMFLFRPEERSCYWKCIQTWWTPWRHFEHIHWNYFPLFKFYQIPPGDYRADWSCPGLSGTSSGCLLLN